ncbi:histidine--tRNA ligase [Lujinxingia litoralis]|uniref:Histidine--tRNA ligase n=1 Tax=Lujinxingia litoralis TaxID=2211119 RepID=A0A328C2L7_9DELT|nr:histidine--tRNA ligase [Lujinxingia litoralis]RAL20031.1 histidine--tRNA ligase [Lujinxingia litoralis]
MSQISTKPASGMRDFLPREAALRKRVFALIEEVYQSYGFQPLETPTLENLSTLMGKYGEEGDQLIFKVMKRGKKFERALRNDAPTEVDLADMGLRYDLTVPLARIVAQYQNELPRYFKRFQIAPVWRADRPQRGRFREFYQCDVDVIGSTSMTVEAEVASAICEVLERLEFKNFRVHLNHRLLLNAMMEAAGVAPELHTEALVAIDKLDKVGLDGVKKELAERGIAADVIDRLLPLLGLADEVEGNEALLAALAERVGELESGKKALSELGDLLRFAAASPAGPYLKIDPYLARGLSYYTGPIFEIRSDDFSGSLGGGGRYDGLVGMFTRQSLPACGFSLGLERVLMLLAERDALAEPAPDVDVLVTLWRDDFTPRSMALAAELRRAGLRVDLYPDADKYSRQFKYANERGVPFVAILAEKELEAGVVAIKDMKRGDQAEVPRAELASWIKARQS